MGARRAVLPRRATHAPRTCEGRRPSAAVGPARRKYLDDQLDTFEPGSRSHRRRGPQPLSQAPFRDLASVRQPGRTRNRDPLEGGTRMFPRGG